MKGSVNSLTGRAEALEGSYLRTFALELKERISQTLAAFVTSILPRPRRFRAFGAYTKNPMPLR